jgi:hypothetical protein
LINTLPSVLLNSLFFSVSEDFPVDIMKEIGGSLPSYPMYTKRSISWNLAVKFSQCKAYTFYKQENSCIQASPTIAHFDILYWNGVMKETSRRRITVTPSLNEIAMD